jgi:hypothetical protein
MEAQRKKGKKENKSKKSHFCSRGENEVWKYFTI